MGDLWISLLIQDWSHLFLKMITYQHVFFGCTAAYGPKKRNNIFTHDMNSGSFWMIGKVRLTWSGSSLLFQSSADAPLFPGVSSLSLQPETPDAVYTMKSTSPLKQVCTPRRDRTTMMITLSKPGDWLGFRKISHCSDRSVTDGVCYI